MQTLSEHRLSLLIGCVVGGVIRIWMAHGDWSLFFNPWFNAFTGNSQPWL